MSKIVPAALVSLVALLVVAGFFLVLPNLQPPTFGAICDVCNNSNCCSYGDACGSNEVCTGNRISGCWCEGGCYHNRCQGQSCIYGNWSLPCKADQCGSNADCVSQNPPTPTPTPAPTPTPTPATYYCSGCQDCITNQVSTCDGGRATYQVVCDAPCGTGGNCKNEGCSASPNVCTQDPDCPAAQQIPGNCLQEVGASCPKWDQCGCANSCGSPRCNLSTGQCEYPSVSCGGGGGGGGTPTPTPPPGGNSPIGYLDVADCTSIAGWSGDRDNANLPVNVQVYATIGGSPTILGTISANAQREQAVCQSLGGTGCGQCPADLPQCKHGYVYATPDSLKDGANHQITAYGLNLSGTGGNPSTLLTNSPRTINCTTTGTIQARAMEVSPSDISCTAVRSSTTGLSGTVFQFTPGSASQPSPQTQSGANYVTFSNLVGGSYTISPSGTGNYQLVRACWSKALNTPTSGEGLTTNLSQPVNNDTLTWDLGYLPPGPWVETQEGGVYAARSLTSHIPTGATPRVFNLDGAGGSPGVVTYGGSYDFDVDPSSQGESLVSSQKWLVESTNPTLNYYRLFANRLDIPSLPLYDPLLQAGAKPSPGRYYVAGDLTTSGNWTIGSGEAFIFLVNGNLTLGGNVNLTGTGFVTFIVNGNITVSPNVGVPYTSTTPVIEGLYVTSPTGSFETGTSSVLGKERLVLQGTFVAGNFLLQRDLDSIGKNDTTAAELFLYNPALPFLMPDVLKDLRVVWEEVAP